MSVSEADLLELREKLRRWLTEGEGFVEIDADGTLSFRAGSTRVFVGVSQAFENPERDDTSIDIFAFVLGSVPKSPSLFEKVARMDYKWGSLYVVDEPDEQDDGVRIVFAITLLGTFVDPEEFLVACELVATTADQLDEELQDEYGGVRFFEEEGS